MNSSPAFVNHVYKPDGKNLHKTIIIYHGYGSTVANYEEGAKQLAALGYTVIVPEIVYHDSRGKLENHFDKEVLQEYFWKAIFETIDESPQFFEELGIPQEEIILIGISIGGFIASGIYARGAQFAGLISINASGSYLVSEKIFRENDGRPELTESEAEIISLYDPNGKNPGNSPILLMHGDQDSIVSIEGQKDYYNYVKTHCDNVAFQTYMDVNHQFTGEMVSDLIEWLGENMNQ